MDCSEARQKILDLLSGELSASEHEELTGHLHICAPCETHRHRAARTWEILGGWPDREPRPELSAQILSQIARESNLTAVGVRTLLPVASAAFVLFIALTFFSPFSFIFDLCRQALRSMGMDSEILRSLVFFVVGALYGGIPLLLSPQFFRHQMRSHPHPRGVQAAFLFVVGAVPYSIILWREFALGVTVTLTLGIVSGALGGAIGGFRLATRGPLPAR